MSQFLPEFRREFNKAAKEEARLYFSPLLAAIEVIEKVWQGHSTAESAGSRRRAKGKQPPHP